MSDATHSRRAFLSSLGVVSAAGFTPQGAWATNADPLAAAGRAGRAQGLASAPGDFLFAPGLVYLQTGSLGPAPRPVMERTIAAWKELELNPARYGYEEHD